MAWRDEWQKAKFRDVEFHIRSAGAALGRRNVVNQYPGRDDPYVEDMGRKAREFTLEAFVIGDDYMAWRDKLEAACEQAGPGELVHPSRGRMQVAVQDCRATESIDQGGLASYSLTFIEAGANRNPSVRVDTPSVVDAAGDTAIAAISEDFGSVFDVEGLPGFVELDAIDVINSALDDVLKAAQGMLPDMNILPDFTRIAAGVLGKITSLMRLPTGLASGIIGQISGLRGLGTSPLSAFKALARLFDFGKSKPAVARTTPARIQQANNREAVHALVRRTALVEAAKAAARIEYASREDAIAARDNLATRIEAEAETAPDNVYFALTDLRVAVVKDIGARSANLASLTSYTPRSTLPAIVLAYQLYEDPERAEEIIARNRVRHPGFVPGGQALEVLADG